MKHYNIRTMRNISKICTLRNLMHHFPKQNYCIYKSMQSKISPCTTVSSAFQTHQIFYSVLSSPQQDADSNIKLLAKEFPEPKNIISQVLNEAFLMDETLDLRPSISIEQISTEEGGSAWQVTVTMKWPENIVIEGIAGKKTEAENIAFLYMCQKLKNLGFLDNANKPLLSNKFKINDKNAISCKSDLLNLYQRIWLKYGRKEYIPKFSSSKIEGIMGGCNFWKSQLHLVYPENKVFEATAFRVRDADNIAAANALLWLYSEGVIDKKKRLVLYSKDDEMKLKQSHQAPYSICIPQESQDKVEAVLSDLKEQKLQLSDKINDLADDLNEESSSAVRDIITEGPYYESSDEELFQRNWQLFEKRKLFESKLDPETVKIKQSRSSLPVYHKREDILKLIDENQVVVLSGETGCGKSTQIPQYILDHYIDKKKGSKCNIIVTQPRRISAISLADRVAKERGEKVGNTVGHQIRLSRCLPSGNGAILYCTTGLLLRKIFANPNLEGISHVIIDEVHERNIHIDFLLIVMQKILQTNKKIKLLLMSASFNTYLFSQYFKSCPVINVPGKAYPVKEYFLEDLLDDIPFFDMTRQERPVLDVDLVISVIKNIDETQPPGAILCFLPGWHDIRAVHSKLLEDKKIVEKIHLCLIHSRIPKEEQMNIFSSPGIGKRKVILATNIAETSITINDVVYVVNSGLHKGTTLDAEAGMTSLAVQWITKANVRQRRGRAGRVQPGTCYHLFTRKTFMEMEEYPVAEISRIPLESVILHCKSYCPDTKAEEFLKQAIQPPPEDSVQCGIQELQTLGVLDESENLTDLGKVAVRFATHPRLSVALIYGAFLRCLDPVLTICSMLTLEKEPFINTLDDKGQIKKIKGIHDNDLCSDHLALNRIFCTWKSLSEETGVSEYLQKHLLDDDTLTRIEQLKQLFAEDLHLAGLIQYPNSYCDNSSKCNENSQHIPSILTALTAAFYPNVVKIIQGEISHGKLHKDTVGYSLIKGQKAYIQKESVISDKEELPSPWLIYFSAMKSEARRLAMMSSMSSVPGVSLLLLPGKDVSIENVEEDGNNSAILVIDGNKRLNFSCSAKEARLLLDTREYLNEILQLYIRSLKTPHQEDSEFVTVCQNKIFSILKEVLDSPCVPFTKGQMYKFVNNKLIVNEL